MFSIVSMQDVLVNLNASEDLFKQFDRPKLRKRSTSIKAGKEKTQAFNLRKLWILPGHIISLSCDGSYELTAYDQIPKIGAYQRTATNLLENPEEQDPSNLLDLIYDVKDGKQFIFLVFKCGKIMVSCFSKPTYSWKQVYSGSLCNKTAQISTIVYSNHAKKLVWSEKRSPSQFCIRAASIKISNDGQNFEMFGSKTLLHNSLPMIIGLISKKMFCFMPSSPNGLMLFWCAVNDCIKLHTWGDDFNTLSIPATSSDFQSIVTSSISLWSGTPINDIKIIAVASHPTTQELLLLQSDLQLHVVRQNEKGNICSNMLCMLEVDGEKDSFAKQVMEIHPVQRLLLVLKMDGVIDIFDVRAGLFLWKTTTFKDYLPNIWTRLGPHPTFGIWNKSGIWNLRPKSITDQIQEFENRKYPSQHSKEKTSSQIEDVEHALDVFEEQKKLQKNKKQRRIKQGVNRSDALPMHYLLQVLNQWKLSNVSANLALTVMLGIKEILTDDTNDDEINLDELLCIIQEINDPVLLLTLFTDKNLPYSMKRKLVTKIQNILSHSTSKYIDPTIMNILHAYTQIDDEIKEVSVTNVETDTAGSIDSFFNREFLYLLLNSTKKQASFARFDHILLYLSDLDVQLFYNHIIKILLPEKSTGDSEEKLTTFVWQILLRPSSQTLNVLIRMFWDKYPRVFLEFVKHACDIVSTGGEKKEKDTFNNESFLQYTLQFIILPFKNVEKSDVSERVEIYCACLQLSSTTDYEEKAFDLFIEYQLFDKALDILVKHNNNSATHYNFFYKLFVALIRHKVIGDYVQCLKKVVPENFNFGEVYVILQDNLIEMGSGSVYTNSSSDLSMVKIKPLLDMMLVVDESTNNKE